MSLRPRRRCHILHHPVDAPPVWLLLAQPCFYLCNDIAEFEQRNKRIKELPTGGGLEAPVGRGRIVEVQGPQEQPGQRGKEKNLLPVRERPIGVRMLRRASGPRIVG